MSNGVELIIASDNKIKNMEKSKANFHKTAGNFSQQQSPILITQTQHKPFTLSPSTLKNQMMILTLPVNNQSKFLILDNDNSFVTKICLTTYTYRTTFVKNGSTHVESKKMVITNSLTDERKNSHLISDVTFSKNPELIVGVFPTTYHFYNTFDKNQESLPFVITSKYTITNTITGPDVRISEAVSLPTYYTNTYFSGILLTRTLYDDEFQNPITTVTTENNLTQVIITETPQFPTTDQQIIRPTSLISNMSTIAVLSLKLPKDVRTSKTPSEKASMNIIHHNNQYSMDIKPSKLYTKFLSSHSKINSTMNFERLRPMLTVVAQLLKKQFISTNMEKTSFRQKHHKTNSTNANQKITENTPYYIPLKQMRQDKSEARPQSLNGTNKRRNNINKLRINSLHIEPPKFHMFTSENSPKVPLSLPNLFGLYPSDITYENGLLSTVIPIRPGEKITASADVIFGRPTNFYDRASHTEKFSGYSKPNIPFLDLRSNNIRNYIILKPPPIPLHKQQLLLSKSSNDFIQLATSPEQIRLSPVDQSIDQYASFNLKTRIQDTSSYDTFYFTSASQKTRQETLKPTLSTLIQKINLKNDVLSHTINMHAAPITFKMELETINSYETPLLAPKNDEVVTLKRKDLAFKVTALKYETKLRSPEDIRKGSGIPRHTSSLDIQKEYPSLYLSIQRNSGIVQGNYNGRFTEYDQNADYSQDSLNLINSISKKRNNKPLSNDCISLATNVSKRTLTKRNESKIISIHSSYNQQKIHPSSQYAEYSGGNSTNSPEKRTPYKANSEFKNFTRLRPFKEIKQINWISNKKIELQTSLDDTLYSIKKYFDIKPITIEASSISTKELFISNPPIKPSLNIITTIETSLRKTFKILEPSENVQDIFTPRNTLLNLLVITKAHSTRKSNYYKNILKPTKTISIDNKLIFKPTRSKSIIVNTTNWISTGFKNNYLSINDNNNNNNNNIPISSIPTYHLKEVDTPLRGRVLSENVPLNQSEIITTDYIQQKHDFITEISTENGIYNTSSSTNVDITEMNKIQILKTRKNMYKNYWISPFESFNNITITKSNSESNNNCRLPCKSKKNEICVTITNNYSKLEESKCVCRPSFARMFPDQPCKPTYTFEMQMQTNFETNHYFRQNDILISNTIILEAANRMLMQSDLRDIFHNIQLKALISTKNMDFIIVQFILKLSENSNVDQIKSVFEKYLRQGNFSIGNTGLYSLNYGSDLLDIKDFDECVSENFNDCSINAYCFNLIGTYTCSCKNGYIDISENAIYPGRICSDNKIGCDTCNYHGKCIITEKKCVECICNSWYAGTKCQVNIKIISIFIIISGTMLAIFLVFYFLLINTSRNKNETFIKANKINSTIIKSTESHTNDTISQSSHKSTLSLKKCEGVKSIPICNMYDIINIRKAVDNPVISIRNHDKSSGRSIALMIPRAKYCWPYISSQTKHQHHCMSNNQYNNISLPDITWKNLIPKHDLNMNPYRLQRKYSHRSIDIGVQPNMEKTLVSGGSEATNASKILMLEDDRMEETTQIIVPSIFSGVESST